MDLSSKLSELEKRVQTHRELLLTEEAAKNALVMPFIQALGYDVFNPAEVVPEFTADVGIKKGEKVDYAICREGHVEILIECKPCSSELSISHASQLYRYFSVTDARLAILTNGVVYQFYSDIDQPNKMDDKPFYTFTLDGLRRTDPSVLQNFSKVRFDIDSIVEEAANLKIQNLLRDELKKEFSEPSEEFVRLMAQRVHNGKVTAAVKERFQSHLIAAISGLIRELVSDRLTSALNVTDSSGSDSDADQTVDNDEIVTTEDEIAGYRIVQAICAQHVDPKRIVPRDQKSYCAILLDDNNRKSLARLHFNSTNKRYIGLFSGKEETRHAVSDPADIFRFSSEILARVAELDGARRDVGGEEAA